MWIAVGWVLLVMSHAFWQACVVNVLFFSALGTVGAQLFASLSAVLEARSESNASVVTTTARAGYSLGYVAGPLLGTAVGSVLGIRWSFAVAAVLYVTCALLAARLGRVAGYARDLQRSAGVAPRARRGASFIALMLLFGTAIVLSGDGLKGIYLSVYVTSGLHQNLTVFGALMAVSAVCEIFVMPMVGYLSERVGMYRVIALALAVGAADFSLLAVSRIVYLLYIVQVMHTFVLCAIFGIGPRFMRLYSSGGEGASTSIFFAGQSLAGVVAGITGSLAVNALGLPGLFWLPGIGYVVVLAVLLVGPKPSDQPSRAAPTTVINEASG